MADFLLISIVIVSLIQLDTERLNVALFFSAMSYAHNLVATSLDDVMYYLSAIAVNLVCAELLYGAPVRTSLAKDLAFVSLLFAIVNSAGLVVYILYHPPLAYNVLCYALYAVSIMLLINEPFHGSNTRNNRSGTNTRHAHKNLDLL